MGITNWNWEICASVPDWNFVLPSAFLSSLILQTALQFKSSKLVAFQSYLLIPCNPKASKYCIVMLFFFRTEMIYSISLTIPKVSPFFNNYHTGGGGLFYHIMWLLLCRFFLFKPQPQWKDNTFWLSVFSVSLKEMVIFFNFSNLTSHFKFFKLFRSWDHITIALWG